MWMGQSLSLSKACGAPAVAYHACLTFALETADIDACFWGTPQTKIIHTVQPGSLT